ncbi:MAG: YbaK/EbsC family protein [Oscillospiraceae bacterium]|nr:YbaK/EbsC family protein [Oscillospiraceae bacterium]
MSAERAKAHLEKFGFADRIKTLGQSSATVELAAAALGCEPARIAKSLTFSVNDKPVMIVTAGDVKIDNAKYKARFGAKAKMLPPDMVSELIGHAVGGVCPFGINGGVDVYLDMSLKQFERVFPAAGSGNTAVDLSIEELERCSEYKEWIDVTKPMQ